MSVANTQGSSEEGSGNSQANTQGSNTGEGSSTSDADNEGGDDSTTPEVSLPFGGVIVCIVYIWQHWRIQIILLTGDGASKAECDI